MSNSSPSNSKSEEKEPQSSRRGKDLISSSRISSCSSPAKSEIDAEECRSSPTSLAQRSSSSGGSHGQLNIKLPRKSTDSSSSDFFPVPTYEKHKSRSPQGNASSISIAHVSSPNERKDSKEKQLMNAVGMGSQYPCNQCGVKYSTIDNLKAHQSFYCTNKRRSNTGDSNSSDGDELGVKIEREPYNQQITNSQPLSGNVVNSKGLLQCNKCKLAIPQEQLNTHSKVCLGSNGSVQYSTPNLLTSAAGEIGRGVGWKCPCCDTYSPTVSAAQKHLEIHTGIKAFKCLLCGYRGNTLRGMRTHIRTHFDKRVSDLLEGEYMTCITANDVEPNANTSFSSNKSHSSVVGSSVSISVTDARNAELNHHHQQHHESGNRQPLEKSKLNHSPPSSLVTTSSPESPQESSSSPDVKIFSGLETDAPMIDSDKMENNNRINQCGLCVYTSSYRGNIIRHMKLVHKISEESADKILTEMSSMKVHSTTNQGDNINETTTDRKLNSSPSSIKNAHIKDKVAAEVSNNVSSLAVGGGISSASRKRIINGQEDMDESRQSDVMEERSCNVAVGRASSSTEEDVDGLSTLQKKEKPCAVKYCKSCDIYFNHLSTFDAHKKSFCSAGLNNKTTERAETPVQ